jgi:hypothetical protein
MLDQTIGAVVNTVAFVAFFAALSGKDGMAIQRTVRRVCRTRISASPATHCFAGYTPANDGWLETVARCLPPQLHHRAGQPQDLGGVHSRLVLGYLPVSFRHRVRARSPRQLDYS